MKANCTTKNGDAMIYFISDGIGHVKIGKADCVEFRLKQLQTGNASDLRIIQTFDYKEFMSALENKDVTELVVESTLHRMFSKFRIKHEGTRSEWFYEKPVLMFLRMNKHQIYETIKSYLPFEDNYCRRSDLMKRGYYAWNPIQKNNFGIGENGDRTIKSLSMLIEDMRIDMQKFCETSGWTIDTFDTETAQISDDDYYYAIDVINEMLKR